VINVTSQRSERAFIIVNPKAQNGKAGREWPELERIIKDEYHGQFHAEFTSGPLHAITLAKQALRERYDLVVALGGDGLLNEVVNGFLEQGKVTNPNATLGVLPFATAADFIKTVGIPRDFREAVKRMDSSSSKLCDVGLISCESLDGQPITRYFINVAEFGVGADVVDRVNRTTKRFGGTVSFTWGILRTIPFYRNKTTSYSIDKGAETEARINNLVIANGRFYGAGLKPAPNAEIDDGLFDISIIGDVGLFESVTSLGKLRDGTYLDLPKITSLRGTSVSARCSERVLIEADGEVVGKLPATFELLPSAIRIRA
jgi:YegS/Rv2252/BmrU family lipid kinase